MAELSKAFRTYNPVLLTQIIIMYILTMEIFEKSIEPASNYLLH